MERRIVFKSHQIDEPPALGFSSVQFTMHGTGMGVLGWEMGFRENFGWENGI